MKSSDKVYLILNKNETIYLNKRQEPLMYRKEETFINQKRFSECKVAIFQLKDIKDIKLMKKKRGGLM